MPKKKKTVKKKTKAKRVTTPKKKKTVKKKPKAKDGNISSESKREVLVIGDTCREILYDSDPKGEYGDFPRLYQQRPARYIASGIWQTKSIIDYSKPSGFNVHALPSFKKEEFEGVEVNASIQLGRFPVIRSNRTLSPTEFKYDPKDENSPEPETKICNEVSRIQARNFYRFKDASTQGDEPTAKQLAFNALITEQLENQSGDFDLVIVDLDLDFRNLNLKELLDAHGTGEHSINSISVVLAHRLPSLPQAGNEDDRPFADVMWNSLYNFAKDNKTIPIRIFASASVLRAESIDLSRDVSIERTASNLAHAIGVVVDVSYGDLRTNSQRHMHQLTCFSDLIVRFGFTGIGHYAKPEPNKKADLKLDFHYDVLPEGGMFRDSKLHGFVQGKESILVAHSLQFAARDEGDEEDNSDPLRLKEGLLACQRFYDSGYHDLDFNTGDSDADKQFYDLVSIAANNSDHKRYYPKVPFGTHTIVIDDEYVDAEKYFNDTAGPLATSSILRRRLADKAKEIVKKGEPDSGYFDSVLKQNTSPKAPNHQCVAEIVLATALAEQIVRSPAKIDKNELLHRFLQVPLCQVGDLSTLDRTEIEGLRSVQKLIRQYLVTITQKQNRSAVRPFSLAIFGPPGSGKSFAAQQLCAFAKNGLPGFPNIEQRTFNVAEFQSRNDLQKAVVWCREQAIGGKVPVVLFDEFDCDHNGRMGWLKDFLPIMEDGEFKSESDGVLKMGPGIYIFAGGVTENFASFRNQIIHHNGNVIKDGDVFANGDPMVAAPQKSKDFLSRLRGFVNILGIDNICEEDDFPDKVPDRFIQNIESGQFSLYDHAKAKKNASKPDFYIRPEVILRRAVLLRTFLTGHVNIQRKDFIDTPLLNAFLLVPRYTHGARSMRSLVNMCNPIEETLVAMSLPALPQLSMHVDGRAFQDIIAHPPVPEEVINAIKPRFVE